MPRSMGGGMILGVSSGWAHHGLLATLASCVKAYNQWLNHLHSKPVNITLDNRSACDIKELCNVNMDVWLKSISVACDIME